MVRNPDAGAQCLFDSGVFRHACKLGLEGIVCKRKGSPYRSGRSPDWLKMKNPAPRLSGSFGCQSSLLRQEQAGHSYAINPASCTTGAIRTTSECARGPAPARHQRHCLTAGRDAPIDDSPLPTGCLLDRYHPKALRAPYGGTHLGSSDVGALCDLRHRQGAPPRRLSFISDDRKHGHRICVQVLRHIGRDDCCGSKKSTTPHSSNGGPTLLYLVAHHEIAPQRLGNSRSLSARSYCPPQTTLKAPGKPTQPPVCTLRQPGRA
jgi:hypothetical protein